MAIAAPTTAAGIALLVSFLAIQLPSFLGHRGTSTAAQASPVHGAAMLAQVVLPLAIMEVALFTAAPFAYRHARVLAAAGAGNRRRLSELAVFISCVAVGLLQFSLFVQPAAGGAVDGVAQARALGLAALRALPASATATYFLGLALVYAHVATIGGNAPVPVVRILTEMTLDAAAALVAVMAMAVYYTQ